VSSLSLSNFECFVEFIDYIKLSTLNPYFEFFFQQFVMRDCLGFVGLAYQGKDIVFRFVIKYSRLRDFGP
jgi:hypothetical protein